MATSLPGFGGQTAQDAQLLAMKAGPAHVGHGVEQDPTITRGVRGENAAIYPSPVPVADPLPGFGGGANPDRTPITHAAPSAAWAQMSAGDAGALASSYHAVKFVESRSTQYDPPAIMPKSLVNDVYPGSNVLAKDIPRQVRGQSDDISQGGGVGNDYGYDSAHVIRYRGGGWVPMWVVGSGERSVRIPAGQGRNTSVNVDSTMGPGGTLINKGPQQYSTPPSPYVAPSNPQTAPGPGTPSGFAW